MEPIVKMEWFGNNYTADQYQAIAAEIRRVAALIDFMDKYIPIDSEDISAMLADIANGADKAAAVIVDMMEGVL